MDGLRDAKNSHWEYGIERKIWVGMTPLKTPNTAVSPLSSRLDMFRFTEKKRV